MTTKKPGSIDLPVPGRINCYWMQPWLMKLYLQRETYERKGRSRFIMMTDDQLCSVRQSATDRGDDYCVKLCTRALDPIDMADRAELCAKILAYEDLREQMERES